MCFDLLCTSIGTGIWGDCIKAQQLSGWSRWCKWGCNNKWTCWLAYTWHKSSNPHTCEWSFCKVWWHATSTWRTWSPTWRSKFRRKNWHCYSKEPEKFWCIDGKVYFKSFNTLIWRIFHIYVVNLITTLESKDCAFNE